MKSRSIIQLVYTLIIIILVNIIGSFVFTRFDLTSEKRYTLSETTTNLLEQIEDVVYIEVYLEGDLPAPILRLKNGIREMLDEYEAYSGNKVEYEFIDPFANPNSEETNKKINQLKKKGLEPPIPFGIKKNGGGTSQQPIMPGAILSYAGKQTAVNFLKPNALANGEQRLNQSIESIEYELTNAITKMRSTYTPTIAILEGHSELELWELDDVIKGMQEYYNVSRARIDGQLGSLEGADLLLIAKPDSTFSEKDKYVIDQFIMQGGKVMWFLDGVAASLDSLRGTGYFMSMPLKLNLEDQLFKYGAKLKQDILMDMKCTMLPFPDGTQDANGRPSFQNRPWPFFPVAFSKNTHPIVRNLDPVQVDFASTLDTSGTKDVKKTILLQSSEQSKILRPPATIGLAVAYEQLDPRQYNKPAQTVALLLEGEFPSAWKNRITPDDWKRLESKEKSIPTKMIVVSDGDAIKNFGKPDNPYELDRDKYGRRTRVGNKMFFMNAINYLLDENGLFELRSREIKIRLLCRNITQCNEQSRISEDDSKKRLRLSLTQWKLFNTILPVVLVILFGLILGFIKRRKYSR